MYEKSEVKISKKDKDSLIKNMDEIRRILNKYPYSNDHLFNFVAAITRVKNAANELERWIGILGVK